MRPVGGSRTLSLSWCDHWIGKGMGRSNAPSTPRDPSPDLLGGTSMSITMAKQLALQAEQARRAAKQYGFSVQALRKQQLID